MAKKTVIISVYNGIFDVDRKPKDVKVVVKDYDTDGVDGMEKDEYGEFVSTIWD